MNRREVEAEIAAWRQTRLTDSERIARALHAITIQQGNGCWNLNEIRHILEGKQP